MQRVRIGLTGLAFVFVLVLLGAVFTRPSSEQPITANSLVEQNGAAAAAAALNQTAPSEPLADVGVTPGNGDGNSVQAIQSGAAPVGR